MFMDQDMEMDTMLKMVIFLEIGNGKVEQNL